MNFRSLLLIIFITSGLFSQQFKHDLTGGYSGRAGNTDFQYWNVSYALTSYGDINFGSTALKDSEFLLAFDKNNATWAGVKNYYNDQSIILKFDLWANGTFSPFIIAESSYDEALGIKSRSNYGIGAKYRVFGDILSVSAAFLQEEEEIIGKSSISLYANYSGLDNADSLAITAYKDKDIPITSYSRLSIRPKIKLPLGDNFYYQSEFYYKPAGDDVLTDWRNSFTIKTAEEWLSIVIKYNIKTDSRPAPKVFMQYDPKYYTVGQSITFQNPGKGVIPKIDRDQDQSIKDGYGDYYINNYKSEDTRLTIGINITF
jgi:hypothetical protein